MSRTPSSTEIRAQLSHDALELTYLFDKHPELVLNNPYCPFSIMHADPRLTNPGLPVTLVRGVLSELQEEGKLGDIPFEKVEARIIPQDWLKALLNHEDPEIQIKALSLQGLKFGANSPLDTLKPRTDEWFCKALTLPTIPQAVLDGAPPRGKVLEALIAHPKTSVKRLREFSVDQIEKNLKAFAGSRHPEIQDELVRSKDLGALASALAKNPQLHLGAFEQLLENSTSSQASWILDAVGLHNERPDVLRRVMAYPSSWTALSKNPNLPADLRVQLISTGGRHYGGDLQTAPQSVLLCYLGTQWKGDPEAEATIAGSRHVPLQYLEHVAAQGVDLYSRDLAAARLEGYKTVKNPYYKATAEELEAAWRSEDLSTLDLLRAENTSPELLQELALRSQGCWSRVMAHPNVSLALKAALQTLKIRPEYPSEFDTGAEALRASQPYHPFVFSDARRSAAGWLLYSEMDPYLLRQAYYTLLEEEGSKAEDSVQDILRTPKCPPDVLVHAYLNLEKGSQSRIIAAGRLGASMSEECIPYMKGAQLDTLALQHPLPVALHPGTRAKTLARILDNASPENLRKIVLALASHPKATPELLDRVYQMASEDPDLASSTYEIQSSVLRNRNVSEDTLEKASTVENLVGIAMSQGRVPLSFQGRPIRLQKLADVLNQTLEAQCYLDSKAENRKQYLHSLSTLEVAAGVLQGTISSLEVCCLPQAPAQCFTTRRFSDKTAGPLYLNPSVPTVLKQEIERGFPEVKDLPKDLDSWDLMEELVDRFGAKTQEEQYQEQNWVPPDVGPAAIAALPDMDPNAAYRILERATEIPDAFLDYWVNQDHDPDVAALARVRKGVPHPDDPIQHSHDPQLLRSWYGIQPEKVLRSAHCPISLIEVHLEHICRDSNLAEALSRSRQALPSHVVRRLMQVDRSLARFLTGRPDFPQSLWGRVEIEDCIYTSQHLLPLDKLKAAPLYKLSDLAVKALKEADSEEADSEEAVKDEAVQDEPPAEVLVARSEPSAWGVALSSAASAIVERFSKTQSPVGRVLSATVSDALVGGQAVHATLDDMVTQAVTSTLKAD